ncbi:HD domain-containing phosphohydrolase [Butyrivibrio sp. AE3004]|uniref:HD domain-containing phosphohydrolase n=1 Tax=Butyrivibrio sp. AE3004 TaxID=1506994 RepID=UPI000691AC49|nr:HD domain-containing phosphohydrolase [Butyrivibrio sp. AE3004]
MKFNYPRIRLSDIRTKNFNKGNSIIYITVGVAINVILSYVVSVFHLPLYLDTIGTIAVSALCGLYPGIITAVTTNMLCMIFNPTAVYYMIININIAQLTALFGYKLRQKKKYKPVFYICAISLISGLVGILFQWVILGEPQFVEVSDMAGYLNEQVGLNYVAGTVIVNVGVNFIDKIISVLFAYSILKLIPNDYKVAAFNCGWKQKPLPIPEREKIKKRNLKNKKSLQRRVTSMLILDSLAIAIIMGTTGLRLYYNNLKNEYRNNAARAAKLATQVVNPNSIDWYLNSKKSAGEYENAEYKKSDALLHSIAETVPGIEYLYIYQIRKDGCYIVFHTNEAFRNEMYIGESIPLDKSFEPYMDAFIKGEPIDSYEKENAFDFMITAYEPIFDAKGRCVGYAGADVSESYLSEYMRVFILRVLLIFSGFFILIIGYGLWMTGFYLIYPINSMTTCLDGFMEKNDDQEKIDENVKSLRELDIRTGDDVEKLYKSICHMALATADQMRDIRYYAEANAKMQNGLIITMADMVENRDSETGAHSQKIAAYVKIILEGLKEKGYYASKITPKYMSDVIASAPLHDIGKINIPDAILNKPGKLTPEEFEIMKTHATSGKQIMEHAISTVSGENYLKEARNMAAYHHERWDGKGYPEGLHGEVIPLSARIMAVADVFDALVSKRVYKPAFPLEKAIEILEEGSGTQFDPKCVEVFLDSIEEVKVVLAQYQNM